MKCVALNLLHLTGDAVKKHNLIELAPSRQVGT